MTDNPGDKSDWEDSTYPEDTGSMHEPAPYAGELDWGMSGELDWPEHLHPFTD